MKVFLRLLAGLALSASVYCLLKWIPFYLRSTSHAEILAPKCPAIADVSHRPLGEQDFSGHVDKVVSGGFTDHYLHDRENKVKAGLREQWGGSLVFFGEDDGANTLDDSALGHGVQLAFYDDSRAFQGCAYNESCDLKNLAFKSKCPTTSEFSGWNPTQAGNKCGTGSSVDVISTSPTFSATITAVHSNPGWKLKECVSTEEVCADSKLVHAKSQLRINESLRFVKSGVLEVEVLITNLSEKKIVAIVSDRHEFPSLFASNGKNGAPNLNVLRDSHGALLDGDKRAPANIKKPMQNLNISDGWVTYQNSEGDHGVGIYWENRNENIRVSREKTDVNSLASNFPFTLPPYDSVRGRFYLLLGGFDTVQELATDLDKRLPPFGRIEVNRIEEDTRTVTLEGWALDNKQVTSLELWVDDKKVSDIPLNIPREDICVAYPGYSMCKKPHSKVGFSTVYHRPIGTGCERPIEVRARDDDGNQRIIARKSISPIVD